MTEHLSNPLETPEGTVRCPVYGTTPLTGYKAKKCRCDVCVHAIRKYNWERKHPGQTYTEKPKRPPGIVWVDWSGITAVVRCERCQKNYGVWLSEKEAAEFADVHRYVHVDDLPFDWDAYDAARLMKQPGGRPPVIDKPLCSQPDCTNDARAKGLCATHYKAASRGHGTHSTYVGKGCRCDLCREANNLYQKSRKALRKLTPEAHGKHSTYVNYGCRCDECRAANAANSRAYRAHLKEASA